jgi:CHAT domain-containing protein
LNDQNGYLIERASIAVAGSTSLYLYALHRDRELASNAATSVLIVGEPGIDPRFGLSPLPFAEAEALELKSFLYKDAETLDGTQATTRRFLAAAKNATIIHFAGHGRANPATPWTSMLFLAPEGADRGELTAWKLLTEASDLAKTRLIVLAACDTASGDSVGPEGVAPLVRPLIAARVPAVVGTLADVSDATTKDLLVSFHCHYRHGDDVAVALQNAQRAMLRKTKSAGAWALFQVVGYADSPYPRPAALEDNSELFPCQDLLYRPDGLHSQ